MNKIRKIGNNPVLARALQHKVKKDYNMGCGCKNKKKLEERKKRLREEKMNPELRRLREEQISKIRENVMEKLKNLKRLSR